MKNKLTLILSILTISTFAQIKNSNDNFNVQNGTLNLNSSTIDTSPNDKEYLGDYKPGKVEGFSEQVSYRYNAFSDNFEFLEGSKRKLLQKVNGLKLNFNDGTKYVALNYSDKSNNITSGYLQVLTDSSKKFVLYKSTKISISQSLNKNSYDGSAGSTNYNTEINYYLGDDVNIAFLPKSAKKIEKILNSGVQDLVKANKLNLSKEEDLIKFVSLLNK